MDGRVDKENIEEWSRQATALSSTDPPLGTVLVKSLNLMATVDKGGVEAPNLGYSMASMKRERELAMDLDENKDDPLRKVVYGVSASLEKMIKSLIARSNEETVEHNDVSVAPQGQFVDEAAEVSDEVDNSTTSSLPMLLIPKDELAEVDLYVVKYEPLNELAQDFGNMQNGLEAVDSQRVFLNETANDTTDSLNGQMDDDVAEKDAAVEGNVTSTPAIAYNEMSSDDEDENEDQIKTQSIRKRYRFESDSDYEEEEERSTSRKKNGAEVGRNKHVCKVCSKVFSTVNGVSRHMGIHTGERRFTCHKCDSKLSRSCDLLRHLRKIHGLKPFQCQSCDASFGMKKQLRTHWDKEGHRPNLGIQNVVGESPHASFLPIDDVLQQQQTDQVDSTDQETDDEEETVYMRRVKTDSRKRPRYESDSDYEDSKENTPKKKSGSKESSGNKGPTVKRHKCSVCSQAFTSCYELACHKGVHTGKGGFACNLCSSILLRSSDLKTHLRKIHGAKPFQCNTCEERFAHQKELREHWNKKGHRTTVSY